MEQFNTGLMQRYSTVALYDKQISFWLFFQLQTLINTHTEFIKYGERTLNHACLAAVNKPH